MEYGTKENAKPNAIDKRQTVGSQVNKWNIRNNVENEKLPQPLEQRANTSIIIIYFILLGFIIYGSPSAMQWDLSVRLTQRHIWIIDK